MFHGQASTGHSCSYIPFKVYHNGSHRIEAPWTIFLHQRSKKTQINTNRQFQMRIFPHVRISGNIKEEKSKVETSSLTKFPKSRMFCMNLRITFRCPWCFIKKCAVVISISSFPSLIAVCFGTCLFVTHCDSDCVIKRVPRARCAEWHYDTWSELSSYQKLKIFIEPWTTKPE